jgi:hypothetical protein
MDHQAFAQLLGNYGEFVGAIAVLATLAYLSVQVRQARNQLNLAGRQARADAARDVLRHLSDIAPIAAKLNFTSYGNFGLDSEDNVRFGAFCHAWMRTEEMNYRAVTASEEKVTQRQLLMFWMSTPWGREFWESNKALYDDSFAAVVDECGTLVNQQSASSESIMATRQ